jgi:hypothetical protein
MKSFQIGARRYSYTNIVFTLVSLASLDGLDKHSNHHRQIRVPQLSNYLKV